MAGQKKRVHILPNTVECTCHSAHILLQIAAEQEESRLREMQREKQARLLQFQRDVKKRVQCLDRLKKQQQLQTNLNAVS